MHPTLPFLLALSLALPLGLADPTLLGTLDLDCQTDDEKRTHDYGPPNGVVVPGLFNGSVGDCAETPVCALTGLQHCCEVLDAEDTLLCDDLPLDGDGEPEYALGGAALVSFSGDPSDSTGGLYCLGIAGHHPQGGLVTVTDLALGQDVDFVVTADHSDPYGTSSENPDCGDGVIQPCDQPLEEYPYPVGVILDTVVTLLYRHSPGCTPGDVRRECHGSCAADFAPGADGAYWVHVGVGATQGHVHL